MIDIDYIHAMDIDEDVDRCFRQRQMIIDEYYGECAAAETQINDLKMFGALTQEKEDYFEESVGDAVRKVGELILKIIEKMKATVGDAVQFLKSKVWVNKDTQKKLDMIAKKDPKAADKLRVAVKKGDLDLNSFKDLNDFFRNMESVLDEIDKRTVDPKSIRAKIQKAKDKLNKNQDMIKTIASAVGIVVSAGGLYISYKNFKGNSLQRDTQNVINRCTSMIDKMEKENDAIRNMRNSVGPKEHDPQHMFSLKAEVYAEIERVATANVRKRTKLMISLTRAFDNLLSSLTGGANSNRLDTTQHLMNDLTAKNRTQIRALDHTRSSSFETLRNSHVEYNQNNRGQANQRGRNSNGGQGHRNNGSSGRNGNQGGGNP